MALRRNRGCFRHVCLIPTWSGVSGNGHGGEFIPSERNRSDVTSYLVELCRLLTIRGCLFAVLCVVNIFSSLSIVFLQSALLIVAQTA